MIDKVLSSDGPPLGWSNIGEYQIAERCTVPSNVEAVIAAYRSPVPQEALMHGIIWIQADQAMCADPLPARRQILSIVKAGIQEWLAESSIWHFSGAEKKTMLQCDAAMS